MTYNKNINNKLAAYFKTRLDFFDYRRGWMKGDCICSRHKKLKFGVNLSRNRTNCFVCGIKPKPIEVVMELEGLATWTEAVNYLNAFEDADYLETPREYLEEKPAQFPESYRLLALGTSHVAQMARNYMKKRGFNILELSAQGVGYCTKGPYAYRIIIPFYERGRLVYFNARQFMDVGPKFLNPPVEDFGVGKNLLMYNVDAIHIYQHIYLVESATNALTLGPKAVALGGKILSNYQKTKLLSSPVENITIILDDDAYDRAIDTALKLALHKRVKVVKMPEGLDINDIGREETLSICKKFKPMKYKDILKLRWNYERTQYTYN